MVCLTEKEYYGENGEPLKIMMIEEGKTFTSPVNHLVAQPVLYAEDDRGRCFVFLYCDWRGPILGEAAAIFDAIHEVHRQNGVAFDDLPDVYFIYLTDYDLTRQGQQVMRLDTGDEEVPKPRSRQEWLEQGVDPDQPEPNVAKWHTIFFNAAMVDRP